MDLIELANVDNRHPWETSRKAIVKKLISSLKISEINFLDVGSGDAYVANELTKDFDRSRVSCVDIEYTPDIINQIQVNFCNHYKM